MNKVRAVQWFRATDIPLSKPKIFRYTPKSEPEKWLPFSASESEALEKACQNNIPQLNLDKGGLSSVDLKSRSFGPTYWDGPKYKVIRGTWFAGKRPLPEEYASTLEKEYQNVLKRKWKKQTEAIASINDKEVKFDLVADPPTASIAGDTWLAAFRNLSLPGGVKAQRGYVVKDDKQAKVAHSQLKSTEAKHLVLCVHGIGHALATRIGFISFTKDIEALRSGFHDALQRSKTMHEHLGSDAHIEALPILWRQEFSPFDAAETEKGIAKLLPQSMFPRNNLLADVFLDYIMYTVTPLREKMQSATIKLMNETFHKFCENNPTFAKNPKVHLVGHSLGSVLVNDILHVSKANRLDFNVDKAFYLGSPVGVLQLLKSEFYKKDDLCVNGVYNILKASDPVASRIEPVISVGAAEAAPQLIESSTQGILNQIKDYTDEFSSVTSLLTSGVDSLWTVVTKQLFEAEATSTDSGEEMSAEQRKKIVDALESFNRLGRVDFQLPEALEVSPVVGLLGHVSYFDNADVASFVLREICDLPQEMKEVRQAQKKDEI